MTDEQRLIGKLEAHVEQLRSQVADMDKKLDSVLALVEQGKGAKWALAGLAALVSAVTSWGAAAFGLFKAPH